jgi:serine/threonine protein kinase
MSLSEDMKQKSGTSTTAALEASTPPPSPPGFVLFDEIGHGGMGVVYRARDEALGRDVAIKFLSSSYSADSPAAQRFAHEARITGQLQHPGGAPGGYTGRWPPVPGHETD